MTVFELLAAAAGAGVVTAYLRAYAYRLRTVRLFGRGVFFPALRGCCAAAVVEILVGSAHPAHVGFFLMAFGDLLFRLLAGNA